MPTTRRTSDNPDGSKTHKIVCAEAEGVLDLNNASAVRRIMKGTEDMAANVKYLAERFNAMRGQLAEFCALTKSNKADAFKFCEQVKALTHGDYGLLLDYEGTDPDVKHIEVEEAGLFAELVKQICDARKVENRMKACCEVNAKIAEAIEGWQSKIFKLKTRTTSAGSSENEQKVAEKKLAQFDEAIRILRKRGSQITAIYFDAKRQLTAFLTEADNAFHVINYNERR